MRRGAWASILLAFCARARPRPNVTRELLQRSLCSGLLCAVSAASLAAPQPAQAQDRPDRPDDSAASPTADVAVSETASKSKTDIVITGRRLDIARDSITPSLGASQYTFNRQALEKQPGGTNL